MGSTLLIGSCEPFSGKSALVLGIARHLRSAGARVLFGKPLATSLDWEPGAGTPPSPLIDDDVRFVGETLGLDQQDLLPSLHLLSAHSGKQRLADGVLRAGEGLDQLRSSLQQPDSGITLLEAAGSLHEGLLYGLSLVQLARDLDAPVVLVHLWEDSRSVDALLAAQQQLGERLRGVVLNAVTPDDVESLERNVVPALQALGIEVLGDATVPAAQRHGWRAGATSGCQVLCCRESSTFWSDPEHRCDECEFRDGILPASPKHGSGHRSGSY